jgi:hypothetical protein
MKEDKIFNNRFNSGDLEYEVFGAIKLHGDSSTSDVYEEYIENRIQQDIYSIFQDSIYFVEYSKNRKVSKNTVAEIYYYFEERLPGSADISAIDKFTNIAEFMGIPYDVLYNELAPTYKEKLLRELDNKYHVFARNKIKRLF